MRKQQIRMYNSMKEWRREPVVWIVRYEARRIMSSSSTHAEKQKFLCWAVRSSPHISSSLNSAHKIISESDLQNTGCIVSFWFTIKNQLIRVYYFLMGFHKLFYIILHTDCKLAFVWKINSMIPIYVAKRVSSAKCSGILRKCCTNV